MQTWQSRPLDEIYVAIFIDAIVVKVRDGQVANRPFYAAIGVTFDGEKDILGLWAGTGGEGAKFWMAVLTDIRNRGVKDVFFVVCDGLKGLPEVGRQRLAAGDRADLINRHWVVAGWSRRSPRHQERTYADACLRGPHADLSLLVEAGRVVASGSCASSAVMRFQLGRPFGDVSGKDVAGAGFFRGRIGCC